MSRRTILLDIALLVLLFFGAAKLRADWISFGPSHQVSAIQPAPEPMTTLSATAARPASAEDWSEIPKRNPFSFDRTDVDFVAPVVQAAKPTAPKPILFGVVAIGDDKMAMLAAGSQPGNRAFRPTKIGENIEGWRVVAIDAKTVVVEAGGVRETLIMNDPTAQVPREVVRTAGSAVAPPPVAAQPSLTQPAVSASTPSSPNGTRSSPAAPGAPCTRTVVTPFGTRTFVDPTPC